MNEHRTFLRGLATLPNGGSVDLIGAPSAVAEPTTPAMIEAHKTWLDMERRFLGWEMAGDPRFIARHPAADTRRGLANTIGGCLAFVGDTGRYHDHERPGASSRAALVLSTWVATGGTRQACSMPTDFPAVTRRKPRHEQARRASPAMMAAAPPSRSPDGSSMSRSGSTQSYDSSPAASVAGLIFGGSVLYPQ